MFAGHPLDLAIALFRRLVYRFVVFDALPLFSWRPEIFSK
jgi:hypothetical protein